MIVYDYRILIFFRSGLSVASSARLDPIQMSQYNEQSSSQRKHACRLEKQESVQQQINKIQDGFNESLHLTQQLYRKFYQGASTDQLLISQPPFTALTSASSTPATAELLTQERSREEWKCKSSGAQLGLKKDQEGSTSQIVSQQCFVLSNMVRGVQQYQNSKEKMVVAKHKLTVEISEDAPKKQKSSFPSFGIQQYQCRRQQALEMLNCSGWDGQSAPEHFDLFFRSISGGEAPQLVHSHLSKNITGSPPSTRRLVHKKGGSNSKQDYLQNLWANNANLSYMNKMRGVSEELKSKKKVIKKYTEQFGEFSTPPSKPVFQTNVQAHCSYENNSQPQCLIQPNASQLTGRIWDRKRQRENNTKIPLSFMKSLKIKQYPNFHINYGNLREKNSSVKRGYSAMTSRNFRARVTDEPKNSKLAESEIEFKQSNFNRIGSRVKKMEPGRKIKRRQKCLFRRSDCFNYAKQGGLQIPC